MSLHTYLSIYLERARESKAERRLEHGTHGEPSAQLTLMLASRLNLPFGLVAASTVVRVLSLQTRPALATLPNARTVTASVKVSACFHI